MKFAKTALLGLSLIVMMTAAAPLVSAQTAHVRWDIASVPCTGPGGGYPCTLNPGASATAAAQDGSTITMTGSGTFVSPGNGGSSSGVTGGGTWKVVSAADGTATSGTYVVTELVQWEKSQPLAVPECGTCETTDNIGNISQAWGGLAVLRVVYSDGTTGVLTLACAGLADPFAITEGIVASKGVMLNNIAIPGINVPPLPPNFPITKVLLPVLFWNPGVFQYFVEFHVS
jgi:hypothetical protein